jgi:hypothetical protein
LNFLPILRRKSSVWNENTRLITIYGKSEQKDIRREQLRKLIEEYEKQHPATPDDST